MEETSMKSLLKPFNLEEAKAGKPVCTREGKPVRILCFDLRGANYPIVAAVLSDTGEALISYDEQGRHRHNEESEDDLMMCLTRHTGYIIVCVGDNKTIITNIFMSFDDAYDYEQSLRKQGKEAYINEVQWYE